MAIQGVSKLGTPTFGGGDNLWASSPQEYSPEVKDYLAKLDAEAAKRGEGYYNALIPQSEVYNSDYSMPVWATDENLRQYINQDIDQNLGYAYAPEGKWGSTGLVSAGPGTNIVLMDDKTGEIAYQGTGFEGAQEAQRRVAEMGGKAPWSIYAAPEGTESYYRWAQNEPQMGPVEGIARVASTVTPFLGMSLPLTLAVNAGLGLASGQSLKDTLINAAGTYAGAEVPGLAHATGFGADAIRGGIAGLGGVLKGDSLGKIIKAAGQAAVSSHLAGRGTETISGDPDFTGLGGYGDGVDFGPDFSGIGGLTGPDLSGFGGFGGSTANDFIGGGEGDDHMVDITGRKQPVPTKFPSLSTSSDLTVNDPTELLVSKRKEEMTDADKALLTVAGIGGLTAAATAGGGGATTAASTEPVGTEANPDVQTISGHPVTNPPITAPPIELSGTDPLVKVLDMPMQPIDTSAVPQTTGKSFLDTLKGLSLADKIKLAQGVFGLGSSLFSGGGGDKDTPAGYGGNTAPVDYDAAVASGRRRQRPSTFDPFTYGQPQGNQPGQFQFFEHYADGGRIDTKAPRMRKSDIAELVEALMKRRELGPLSISPQWNDVDIGLDQGIGDVLASAHTRLRGGTNYDVNAPLAGGRVDLHARANQYRPDTAGIGYEHPLFGGNIGVGVDRGPGGTSGRVGYTRGFAEGGEPTLLDRAAQTYPFLKQYSPVILQGEGEGEGNSETWRRGEPGDKAHPRPPGAPIDQDAVEFYGKPSEQGLAGEVMHLDAKANATRETLRRTMTHEQIERLKRESGDYQMSIQRGMSEEDAIRNALDGAVRGYVIGQWPEDANARMGYDKKQRKALDDLKQYVTGAPAKAEGGGIGDAQDHARAYAQGSGHDGAGPVVGIGGGQEDRIPAWLSDGEYVWSAQDVSDLGDGSTNEGVRRLDKMRAQVRRQAGRKDVKKIAKPQAGIGDLMAGAV